MHAGMSELMVRQNQERIARYDGFDHPEFGTRMHKVDMQRLPNHTLEWQDGFAMVRPKDPATGWTYSTAHLRTVLLDHNGYVHSAGFPAGQGPNAPVIVVDLFLGDQLRLREQGRHDLGPKGAGVIEYITDELPALVDAYAEESQHPFFQQHSLLFLWENTQLVLLGYVDKGTLCVRQDPFTLARLSNQFCCQVIPV